MKIRKVGQLRIFDHEPKMANLRDEVFEGLSATPKYLPSKLFYDERGSRLFDQICDLEEYYPTRTEMSILEENIGEISKFLGENCLLVEFGSGTGAKTKYLLDHLENPAAYMPIEIDCSILEKSALAKNERYPEMEVIPVCADFFDRIKLPKVTHEVEKTVAFFPGSTLGNFRWEEALNFLRNVAIMGGPGGGMLLGIDLQKDIDVLERAYNDAKGVTADFNLNLLQRINNELEADFDLDAFKHYAYYNREQGRIEMHIVSLHDQEVHIGAQRFSFAKGEHILTEYSHKYDLDRFAEVLDDCGFEIGRIWTDERDYFAVLYLHVKENIHERFAENGRHYHIDIGGDEATAV